MSPILQCYGQHQFAILSVLGLYNPPRVKWEPVGRTKTTRKERQVEILAALKSGPMQTTQLVEALEYEVETVRQDLLSLEVQKKVKSKKVTNDSGRIASEWRLYGKV